MFPCAEQLLHPAQVSPTPRRNARPQPFYTDNTTLQKPTGKGIRQSAQSPRPVINGNLYPGHGSLSACLHEYSQAEKKADLPCLFFQLALILKADRLMNEEKAPRSGARTRPARASAGQPVTEQSAINPASGYNHQSGQQSIQPVSAVIAR